MFEHMGPEKSFNGELIPNCKSELQNKAQNWREKSKSDNYLTNNQNIDEFQNFLSTVK